MEGEAWRTCRVDAYRTLVGSRFAHQATEDLRVASERFPPRRPSLYDLEDLGEARRLNHQYRPHETTAHVASREALTRVERGTNGVRIAARRVTTRSPITQAPIPLQATFERPPISADRPPDEVDELHAKGCVASDPCNSNTIGLGGTFSLETATTRSGRSRRWGSGPSKAPRRSATDRPTSASSLWGLGARVGSSLDAASE